MYDLKFFEDIFLMLKSSYFRFALLDISYLLGLKNRFFYFDIHALLGYVSDSFYFKGYRPLDMFKDSYINGFDVFNNQEVPFKSELQLALAKQVQSIDVDTGSLSYHNTYIDTSSDVFFDLLGKINNLDFLSSMGMKDIITDPTASDSMPPYISFYPSEGSIRFDHEIFYAFWIYPHLL